MCLLVLSSSNPDFTWLVGKRPESGPQPRKHKRGHMLGWFPNGSRQEYAVWFKDGDRDSSYQFRHPDQQAQPASDPTRYNSAMFVVDAFATYFRSPLWLHGAEQDIPDKYEHTLFINQMFMKQDKYIKIFRSALGSDFQIEEKELSPKNFQFTFRTKRSAQDLLSFVGIFCLFNVLKNNNEVYDLGEDAVVKFANITVNFNAPYFIRYVFKSNLLRNMQLYEKVKPLLDTETISLEYGTTSDQRQRKLKEHFLQDMNVVDFGCGEGTHVSHFARKQQAGRLYFAVDRDEEARRRVTSSCKRKKLTQVRVSETMPEMLDPYQVFLTEVVEHNDQETSAAIIQGFLADPNCWQLMGTTPNKDFNVFYNMAEDDIRHHDHLFEFTTEEFQVWLSNIDLPEDWKVEFSGLGDIVEGVQPTFFFKFKRTNVDFSNIPQNSPALTIEEEVPA